LYDLLVPDERALIPRAAFATWFAGEATTSAGRPQLDGIRPGTWTSDLTGNRYDVVFVDYTVAADQRVEEMVLWRDDGSWRWFFQGAAPEIAVATDADVWSVDYDSPYRTEMFRNIDRFWAQV